jgi:FSR family fosmidomycin resistance protein-like MFS transporter
VNLKIILILSLSHLITDLTGSALPAMMPFLKNALQLSYTAVGAVIMVSNMTSSLIQPLFGYLSDKMELKWFLPVSIILTCVGFSFLGLAPSFLVLLILVTMNGMGIAFYHPEGSKIMHYFSGSRMATGMSFFQVGGNLGMALGPLFITYAIALANLSGTLFYLLLGIPMFGVLLLFLKELTLPVKREKSNLRVKRGGSAPEFENKGWGAMALLVFAVSMRSWAHMGLITFVPFYYIQFLNGDAITAGRLVFVFLMGGAVGTLIGAPIADRIGHKYYFCLSMILSVPLLFLFLQVGGIWVFIILFLVGLLLISSFSVTIVMGQLILKNRLGMASGLTMGFVIGMGGIGAGLLGIVADSWGVMMVLKLIAYMPAVGFIPAFMIPYDFKTPTPTLSPCLPAGRRWGEGKGEGG